MSCRRPRKSSILTNAQLRHNRLTAIDPKMDLGGDLSLAKFQAVLTTADTALSTYNQHLAAGDDLLNNLEDAEDAVADLYARMLAAIAAHYGKDSHEYEQAGGTRLAASMLRATILQPRHLV